MKKEVKIMEEILKNNNEFIQAKANAKLTFWQRIGIYVIAAGVLYMGIYYFVIARRGAYASGQTSMPIAQQQLAPLGY